MSLSHMLSRRATEAKEDLADDGAMKNLLVTLVVLIAFGIVLGGSLFAISRHRKQCKEQGVLPTYEETTGGRGARLTIQTNRDSTYVYSEKQNLIDNSSPMPLSPDSVPEIRITFPEEEDKNGRRVSGRVMVVQVGEAGVGFIRPLEDEKQLPAYDQTRANDQYTSVDIERIGGLKEIR